MGRAAARFEKGRSWVLLVGMDDEVITEGGSSGRVGLIS